MTLERLLARATLLLGRVDLVEDLSFSNRAAVARVQAGDGTTAIVKEPSTAEALAREVEALRLLPGSVRPALLGTDDRVVIMEDLGAGPSLADLLLGESPADADAGLLAWAKALGTALRSTLGDGREPPPPEALSDGLQEMRLLADQLGATVPPGIDEDASHIASVLSAPGPWLAFCPGDTCPDNNRILADGSVRFFDLEASGWRHAAMEAAYCRTPFCTCWCVAALPSGTTQRMEEVFLDALAPPQPERFVEVIGLAAVAHTLASFDWFRRFVVEDRPAGPPDRALCRGRQYVYPRLLAVARQRDRLPALALLAADLVARIAGRWPEAATMPLYPAFR